MVTKYNKKSETNVNNVSSSDKEVSMFPKSIKNKNIKTLINCVRDHENCNSYSSIFLKIQGFKNYAKASMHAEACKKWFEKIILGEDEEAFNKVC